MNIDLSHKELLAEEREQLESVLREQNPNIDDDLEQIWYLIDLAWEQNGCDNKHLDWDKIGRFYAHPVWLLNGLFIESHALSTSIRKAIAQYIANKGFSRICDFGGGFGSLAKEIARLCPNAEVDIYEPFPSEYGKKRIKEFSNISFVSNIKEGYYDCLVSTDVLEHVDDVLGTFETMLDSIKIGGEALIGNCFYPVIKCHLPKHFHYRYSFKYVAMTLGLKYGGVIDGAEYVQIYTKHKTQHTNIATKMAMRGGQLMYVPLNILKPIVKPILKPLLKSLKNLRE